jgi:hypothetical protein
MTHTDIRTFLTSTTRWMDERYERVWNELGEQPASEDGSELPDLFYRAVDGLEPLDYHLDAAGSRRARWRIGVRGVPGKGRSRGPSPARLQAEGTTRLDHGMSRHRHFLLKPAGHRRWIQDRCSMFAICATRLHICAESYALRSNASSSGRTARAASQAIATRCRRLRRLLRRPPVVLVRTGQLRLRRSVRLGRDCCALARIRLR